MAAMLVLLLTAALVIGGSIWRNGDLLNRGNPAGQGLSIKQYQAMVAADQQRWADAPAYNCSSFGDPGCLFAVAQANAALQRWLDDLNRTQPPVRFAALDAQMRTHLANAIVVNNAYLKAYEAHESKAPNILAMRGIGLPPATNNPKNNGEIDWLEREAADVIGSQQGTVESYKAAVALDRAYLLACALCQMLMSHDLLSCQAAQVPTCLDDIYIVRLQVEIFQGHTVSVAAPDSLAAKDARLQTALDAADKALDVMESALSAGDLVALEAGRDNLRVALVRVDVAAAAIGPSN